MYDTGLKKRTLEVISSLSLSLERGEVLAVVGSSGSGKSLLAHSILGILPSNCRMSGSILYKGTELNEKRLVMLRGREIAFVPQSVNCLDPRMKIGRQVRGIFGTKEKEQEILRENHLEPEAEDYYPYQLSGGMARRVLLSTAETGNPNLVVADEPTPGLSLDLAQETLLKFRKMAKRGCGVIIITHDIDLALIAADRIAVFYAGSIVEIAPRTDFCGNGEKLRHPYSRALWRALPQNEFHPIAGFQPYAGDSINGCVFASRCVEYTDECSHKMPLCRIRGGEVRCCHAI